MRKPEYQECYEPAADMPEDVAIDELEEKCLITLESGADISVLPMSYASVGERREGDDGLK